jgi:hypothetical protein
MLPKSQAGTEEILRIRIKCEIRGFNTGED